MSAHQDPHTRVTFVTGSERSGKTMIAKALYLELAPRSRVLWFDETPSAASLGAKPMDSMGFELGRGRQIDNVIISAGDSAFLAVALRHLGKAWVSTIRCDEARLA